MNKIYSRIKVFNIDNILLTITGYKMACKIIQLHP